VNPGSFIFTSRTRVLRHENQNHRIEQKHSFYEYVSFRLWWSGGVPSWYVVWGWRQMLAVATDAQAGKCAAIERCTIREIARKNDRDASNVRHRSRPWHQVVMFLVSHYPLSPPLCALPPPNTEGLWGVLSRTDFRDIHVHAIVPGPDRYSRR
jgi:hypothetical protein